MVDIAAHLSLTSSGSAIDLSANRGAETANTQAFGNILAGRVQANGDTGAPAAPLRPFPAPAGNRQPAGKILPGAAQILPDAAPLGVEAAEAKPAEGSPVHGLIKMLAAGLTGQHPAVDQPAEEAPAETETASADAETAEPATLLTAPALAMLQFALPVLTLRPDTAPPAGAPEAPHATPGGAAPILLPALAQQADAALRELIRPALAQFLAQPVQSAGPAEASAVAVLTVAAIPAETSTPALTLVSAPALPVGQTISAQIKVAAEGKASASETADRPVAIQPQVASRDVAVEAPVAASRAASAVRTVLGERAATDLTAAPATSDSPLQLAATPAVSAPILNTSAPVAMPRHDFAALVDRLVEARNAIVSQSTHASLNHAEFGQVSLHFQQDGGDLKVGMSSADPDFARAAQAAQAMKPAERQTFTADTNSRGQNSSQTEAGNGSSKSHAETSGYGSDQQNRNSQGRNPRGGSNTSNPAPRWAGRDQSQSRGGIFA